MKKNNLTNIKYDTKKMSSFKEQFLVLRQVLSLLPKRSRKQFWSLLLAIISLSVIETGTVGVIAFFAAAVSNPSSTIHTKIIVYAQLFLGDFFFSDPKVMIGALSVFVVLIVGFKNLFRGVVIFSISRFSAYLETEVGTRLLSCFLQQPYQWYLRQNSADLAHAVEWRRYLGRMFVTPSLNVLSDCFLLGTLLGTLLWINPLVFFLFLVTQGGVTYFLYGKLRFQLDRSAAECRDYERSMNREVTKAIHGLKDVKISQSEPYFIEGFVRNARPFARHFGRQQFWKESPLLSLETVGFVLITGTIGFMLFVLNLSPLQITGLTAFLAVTSWRTLPALNRVISSFTSIGTALPYVSLVMAYFRECSIGSPTLCCDNATMLDLVFKDEIRFERVCFGYDGTQKLVLQDLTFSIKKGRMFGILGASGAGKSTLVDLLTGLLEPVQGQILIDGNVLDATLRPRWLSAIGYVSQFPYLIDGTLAENIAFGVPIEDVDLSRIEECCRLAAMGFVQELPQGVDTLIGERGIRLSGGQRQRVAIARALYRQPDVLIFDEATSSLDQKNESDILTTIINLGETITVVVISHKESVTRLCEDVVKI